MDIPEKNKHYFAKNLLVLQQSQPDLSFRISKLKPSSCYQWLETKTGSYSVEISSGKTPLLLHSRHDPIKEAKREIRSLSVDTPSVFVFLGIGLGHSLDVLWEQHRGDITALLLVERNVEFFYFFLHASDWTHILSNPNTRILVSDKADDILTAAHSLLPQIMGSGIRFVDHRPSYQIHADFYAKCVENLRRFLQQAAAESELLVQHGSLIQRNAILNLPAMCSSHGLGPLRNYFKDQPAVLIAAGPSLNNTIKHLKKYRTDVLVFCVDTAYSLVLKEGIVPDFVSATDPTELNERHFDGIPPQNKVVLLFESDVYPTIPERWKGPLIFVNSEKSAINRWIEEIGGPFGSFDQGLSVSHTQYTAASWLGCSPIILIGHDFAYSPGGGFTHAKGTVLNRKIQPPKSEAKDVVIEKSTFIPTDTVEEIDWVLGVRGSLVPTSKTLKVLLAKFSDMIKISGSTVFDATEAGALIEGSIPTKFESILCSLERNTQVSPIVSFLEEHQDPQDLNRLDAFEDIIQTLRSCLLEAKQGLHLIEKIADSPLDDLTDLPEWEQIDAQFWKLYRNRCIQITLEQALFPSLFMFIRREKHETSKIRLTKYQCVFQSIVKLINEFIPYLEKSHSTIKSLCS